MLRFYFYSGVEYDQNLTFIKAFKKLKQHIKQDEYPDDR